MNSKQKLKRKLQDEHRVFQEKWEQEYFCVLFKNKVICLICQNTVSVLKEYHIKRHYDIHREIYDKYEGKIREYKLQEYKKKLQNQQNVFIKMHNTNESVVKVSYELSPLIASCSKPFTEGDFVKQCIIKAAETICPEKVNAFKEISLSRNTVADRIVDMANNLRGQLENKSALGEAYSIAIDESTDVTDIAQLAIYMRVCDSNIKVSEELLELVPMNNTTTSENIFNKLQQVLSKYNIPLEKVVCLVTDGAPAMLGKNNGVAAKLLAEVRKIQPDSSIINLHCIIHQQVLCSKKLKMNHVLKFVTKTVNFIRARGLNHRQFKLLLEDIGNEFQDISYYTEVRWLSCHRVLKRFFQLKEEIILFFELKGKKEEISELKDCMWIQDLAFLVDITGHLYDLNLKLQGKSQLITHMYDNVKSFKMKLELWIDQLKLENLAHFAACEELKTGNKELLFQKYVQHMNELKNEFSERFQDFAKCENDFSLFTGPFLYNPKNATPKIQLELIELQCDSHLKAKYYEMGVPAFYTYLPDNFKEIRKLVTKVLAMFGSTYLCEKLFSLMKTNKTAHRSRLTDEHLSALMKIVSAQEL